MTAEILFAGLLAVSVTGLAAYVVLAKDLFAAIAGFVAFGLLMSLAWVVLGATDVAMTEAALGSGVTGALLLGACGRLRKTTAGPAPGWVTRGVALILCGGVTVALCVIVVTLPDPPPTLAPATAAAMGATGLGNPVTGVLMVFRALDTLLEKVVLLLALVGVWSLASDRFWPGRPLYGPTPDNGALRFLSRFLIPAGAMTGIYLFWAGADDPGGAFAGGAILSAMGLLAFLAGVCRVPSPGESAVRWAAGAGVAVFLCVGLAGLALGTGFLTYPESLAKPVIVLIEVAMTLSIGVTLALLVTGPSSRLP